MLGKLLTTPRGTKIINCTAAAVGIVLVIVVSDTRIGVITFIAVTAVESGVFSLIYGLRSDWREEPAARAVFWAVFAYFGVTAQLLTLYLSPRRWWWSDDLRELLFLGLSVAGLNLVLTVVRLLGPRVLHGDGTK